MERIEGLHALPGALLLHEPVEQWRRQGQGEAATDESGTSGRWFRDEVRLDGGPEFRFEGTTGRERAKVEIQPDQYAEKTEAEIARDRAEGALPAVPLRVDIKCHRGFLSRRSHRDRQGLGVRVRGMI